MSDEMHLDELLASVDWGADKGSAPGEISCYPEGDQSCSLQDAVNVMKMSLAPNRFFDLNQRGYGVGFSTTSQSSSTNWPEVVLGIGQDLRPESVEQPPVIDLGQQDDGGPDGLATE